MTTALLVIDVQQGLCSGENPADDAAHIIARINRVAAKARQASLPVIFIQHEAATGMLEYGTADWQLAQGLEVTAEDIRVRKTTPDAFNKTHLETILERHGVTELVICGIHTEFCVDTTTRRALALGYPVILIADAHTTAGNAVLTPRQIIDHHNATLTQIASFGPRVRAVSSADITFGH